MSKPIIPREVAEAIESLRKSGATNEQILHSAFAANCGTVTTREQYEIFRYRVNNFETFVRAVIDGYEVDETPEDMIRKRYEGTKYLRCLTVDPSDASNHDAYMAGMRFVLDTLGIKIEGVNA